MNIQIFRVVVFLGTLFSKKTQHRNNTTLLHCNIVTLQHCNIVTLQHCNIATLVPSHIANQNYSMVIIIDEYCINI